MNHFIRHIDRAIFSILKDNSFLLEHAKQIITEDRHLGQSWYVSHEDSPSWSILTIKAILISPTFLLHEPWRIGQLLNLVLDDFTVLGEVSTNVGSAALKERILRVLVDHKDNFLLDPTIDIGHKGLYNMQLKLTSFIITHLQGKNF